MASLPFVAAVGTRRTTASKRSGSDVARCDSESSNRLAMDSTSNLGQFHAVWTFDREVSDQWIAEMADALTVLQERDGFISASIVRSVDEGSRCQVQSTWVEVGAYRRAVSSSRAKMILWPMLADVKDEPSAFEEIVRVTSESVARFTSSADHS